MSEKPEFDDEVWHGPFRSSEKARREIAHLAHAHGLVFTHNPGGGCFYLPSDPRRAYQISTNDDVEDLQKLRAAIAANPPK